MKRNFANILLLLSLVLVMAFTSANAAANAINYNTTTQVRNSPGMALFSGSWTTTASDSIGTFYTKGMLIGALTDQNAYFDLVMSNDAGGTEDVNVYVYYSYDNSTWFLGSQASGKIKDQLTTTAVRDTLNVVVGVSDVNYTCAKYMRLKFECQAGNPIGTTCTWYCKFYKNPVWPAGEILAAVQATND